MRRSGACSSHVSARAHGACEAETRSTEEARRFVPAILLLLALPLLTLAACEKQTHRDSRRRFQEITSEAMSDDARARALEEFVHRYPEPKTNPNLARACQALAHYHARRGRADIASSWYERALRAHPGDPDLLNRLGYHYARAGMNLDRAVEVLELAVRLAEERGYSERRQGFFKDSLGWAYRMRGDLPRAVALLEEACRLAPGVAILREHLAEVYRALGEHKRAGEIYLELYIEGRGTTSRFHAHLMSMAEQKGPSAVARLERRIRKGLRKMAEDDRRAAEAEGASLVRLEAPDGQAIVGWLYEPSPSAPPPPPGRSDRGAVLLLHALGADRAASLPAARLLAERGLFALALDLRGHGDSIREGLSSPLEFSDRLDDNLIASRDDALTALEFLRARPGVDRSRIGAAGEGIGGLVAAQALEQISSTGSFALVILSPWGQAAAYHAAIGTLGPGSTFLVAAENDHPASATVSELVTGSGEGSAESLIVPGGSKGFSLLQEDVVLRGRFAEFLTGRLRHRLP
ncbi:MAG: tetratricopeptide repeat protein [Acidobacteriota bacterium]